MAISQYDVFISHAAEDKDDVARPLAIRLQELGVSVWYDEDRLQIGDSLSRAINFGLARSGFGLLIVSEHFFAKRWPQQELAGLLAQGKDLLPVWHKVAKTDVVERAPMLADLVALSTGEKTINEIAIAIARKVADMGDLEAMDTGDQPWLRDVILYGAEYDDVGADIESWGGNKTIGTSVMQAKWCAMALMREMGDIPFNTRDRREHIIFNYLEPACQTVLEIAATNREPLGLLIGSPWSRLSDAIIQTNAACTDLMNHYGPQWGIFEQAGFVSRPTGEIIRWYADRMYYSLLNVDARLRTT